jgi:hypothetical protein
MEAPQMTAILRIQHPVGDFERWRETFDSDPDERQRNGVCSYRILRGHEDPNDVLIDLEFARVVELVEEHSLIAAPGPS